MDEKLQKFWDSINESSIPYFQKNYKSRIPELLEFLMLSVFENDEIDVGIVFSKKPYSIVSLDWLDGDKALELRMYSEFHLELELRIYDYGDDEDEVIFNDKLSEEECKGIPIGLFKLMNQAVTEERDISMSINSLN